MNAYAGRTLVEIEREIRAAMDSPECIYKHRFSRMLYEAGWLADEVAKEEWRMAGDDTLGSARVWEELQAAGNSVSSLFDNDRWDRAGYIYKDTPDEDAIGDFRRLAEAMENAASRSHYASGLTRHARVLREALAKSEVAAQASVLQDVITWRRKALRWRIPMAAVGFGGILYLWGRPLSWWVAPIFLVCVEAIRSLGAGESKDAELRRRCKEIGWPLKV